MYLLPASYVRILHERYFSDTGSLDTMVLIYTLLAVLSEFFVF